MFVDVANMYYAARGQDVDVDYVALLKHATKGRDLIRAYAYTGLDPENENQRKFIDFLGKNGYKPVVNDDTATALVREAIAPKMRADLAPIMGGDDFSAYLDRAPGCYAFIGAGDEGSGATFPHHHPRFRIDERALAVGVRLHVDVARRALKELAR